VIARVVLSVDDNPDGNVVVIDLSGEDTEPRSGVCVVVTVVPSGVLTVVLPPS